LQLIFKDAISIEEDNYIFLELKIKLFQKLELHGRLGDYKIETKTKVCIAYKFKLIYHQKQYRNGQSIRKGAWKIKRRDRKNNL
jgi:hypothetical protein